ncbi:MAG: MFS transporter, partial [archaeon]|nr:MFS transporter [archaeon]
MNEIENESTNADIKIPQSNDPAKVEEEGMVTKKTMKYIIFLVVLLGLAHALDEYSSLAASYVATPILVEFFGPSDAQQAAGQQLMGLLQMLSMVLMLFSTAFRGLQDKIGRRKIFILSTLGMTLGVLTIFLSPNFGIYYMGSSFMMIFLFNDMQYVYINEETPSNKRAQAFTAAKIFGLIAILLIPSIRKATLEAGIDNWRMVFLVPLVIGTLVIILAALFLKETHAFEVLQEDRRVNPEKYKEEKISIGQVYKDLKKNKNWPQIKWLIRISMLIMPFALMNLAQNEVFMQDMLIPELDVQDILYWMTVFQIGCYLIQGQITDRVGRKASYVMNSLIVIISLPIEWYFISNHNENVMIYWIIAFCMGFRVAAFWNITDLSRFLFIENVPTRIRGTAQVVSGLITFFMMPLGIILNVILLGLPVFQGNTFPIVMIFG